MMKKIALNALLVTVSFLFSVNNYATTFTPGNLVVQSQCVGASCYEVSEYNLSGQKVQSFSIPKPVGQTDLFHPRDIALDSDGNFHVFNGTFNPYLSTLNGVTDNWQHISALGWSTVNNASYGGLATFKDNVFVTNMNTSGNISSGVVVFNQATDAIDYFASGLSPIDLNVGLDGQLYVLNQSSNVYIYDPNDFTFNRSFSLDGATDVRSIAADEYGNVYAATWGGLLHKYDALGTKIDSITTGHSAIDLDVSEGGLLALGTRLTGVFVTDTSFSFASTYDNGRWNSFVNFIPSAVPEPSTTAFFTAGLAFVGLIEFKRKANQKSIRSDSIDLSSTIRRVLCRFQSLKDSKRQLS